MKNSDWTKWYSKTSEKIKEENEKHNALFEGMTDREKQTAELINKRYREIEQTVNKTVNKLNDISNESDFVSKKAKINADIANHATKENVIADGDNRMLNKELASNEVDKVLSNELNEVNNESETAKDKLIDKLDESVATKQNKLVEEVRNLEKSLNTKEDNAYDSVKNEIDAVLANNRTDHSGVFYNVKDELLKIIQSSKGELGDRADELIKYVESKNYYTSTEPHNTTIYVNDKKYEFTNKEIEMMDSIKFDSYGRVGLVYGDGLKLEYNGKKYKATAGETATDGEKSIITAICARKKITPKVGTCICYRNRIYAYAGDNYWRCVKEIGKVNEVDGLYALVTDYKSDLEGTNENEDSQGN